MIILDFLAIWFCFFVLFSMIHTFQAYLKNKQLKAIYFKKWCARQEAIEKYFREDVARYRLTSSMLLKMSGLPKWHQELLLKHFDPMEFKK